MPFCRRADKDRVLVGVVVVAGTVVDLAARMAALHLDRGMADVESIAQPLFQVTDHVLRVA
jgi:hypothetical protein